MKQFGLPLLVLYSCFLCSCNQSGRSNKLTKPEIDACAWLIEDLCHGLERSPRELVSADSSIGQLNIATWLALGDLSVQQNNYPLYIQKRRNQWLLLQQGLQTGSIKSLANGYLQLNENVEAVQRNIFDDTINSENQLRLNVDRLALQHAGLEARSQRAQSLLQALLAARLKLDQVQNHR